MAEMGRVVVLGAGGLLGGALGEAFALHDFDYHPLTRAELDITDEAACRRVIGQIKPDVVINCAAYTKVDQAEEEEELAGLINGRGAGYAASAAAEVGARIIYFSTDFVFDGRLDRPYTEDDPPAPISAYGRTKWAGETATRQANPEHTILRTSWLYGPHGPNFIETIIRLALDRDELTVVDDQIGSPTYALDLAAVIPLLCHFQLTGTFHLTNSGQTSWFGLAEEALRLEGLKVKLRPISSDQLGRPAARPAYSVLDCGRLAEYNIALRPWPDALAAYLARRSTK